MARHERHSPLPEDVLTVAQDDAGLSAHRHDGIGRVGRRLWNAVRVVRPQQRRGRDRALVDGVVLSRILRRGRGDAGR